MVQRGHVYAIVDEVDSILIDEARTPLIISGPSEENTENYYKCNRIIPRLVKGDETKDKYGNKTTTGRLPRRREVPDGRPDRRRGRQGREAPRSQEPLRPHEHRPPPRDRAGPSRARPLPERRRLHDQGRPGPDRRRVHGPRAPGTALVRRPPSGGRGEGGRQDRAREPDARDHHPSELLPPLREARRNDGHRRYRGGRVPPDLQARRRRHPDEPADDPGGQPGRGLRLGAGEVRGRRRRDRRLPREAGSRCWSEPSRSRSPSSSRRSSRAGRSRTSS